MLHLDLTDEEAQMLRGLIENCITDLRGEIWHTDGHNYREMLKAQEALLKKMLHHLEAELVPA